MKKIIGFLALLLILTNSHAQTVKLPTWDITSRTTGQRGYNDVTIRVWFTATEGKGRTLNFISNTAINKVEMNFIDNSFPKSISTYNDNTKTGFWYLESGAYKSGLAKGWLL